MPELGENRRQKPHFRWKKQRLRNGCCIQQFGHLKSDFRSYVVKMKGEGWHLRHQAKVLLNVGQEIMVEHQRDFGQQHRVNAGAFKDAINGATLQVDLPCKLRYGHPALVEDGFYELPDMKVLRSHVVLSF